MKVGIIGPAKRAVAWEKHLAGHPSVSEVIIAADLKKAGDIDASLLLNESDKNVEQALQSVKQGIHTFLISKLPVGNTDVEKLFYASEEADVRLQFSHWPTLAPASHYTSVKIPKPSFIQVIHEKNYANFRESDATLYSLWIDELAYCLKCINSSVHRINNNKSVLKNEPAAFHTMLQFDNGATAVIYINVAAEKDNHRRFISNANLGITCRVETQQIRITQRAENGHLFFDRKEFDPSKAAEQAVIKFLKAIQLKKPTLYSGYDLLRLSRTLKGIEAKGQTVQ